MDRACSTNVEKRSAYRILVESQKERPRRRWLDNIKIDLRDIEWEGMDWIDLAQDRDQWSDLVNTVMKLRIP
jgi:hypothetical protein